MNIEKLRTAEAQFLQRYPGGFLHPDMQALAKKHKMDKQIKFAQSAFAQEKVQDMLPYCENMVKAVSRSSMVSMFEKPKFRDFVYAADEANKLDLVVGLNKFLHGDQQQGFELLLSVLKPAKLAKWSLLTVIPNYYHPDTEVFIKPTTAKGVIDFFELKDLHYKPQPTWAFYEDYRNRILDMKALVDPEIAPSNAAFCGFLMMSLKGP